MVTKVFLVLVTWKPRRPGTGSQVEAGYHMSWWLPAIVQPPVGTSCPAALMTQN